MNVPNHEKKPFREMTPEERSAIVEAWIYGNIEALTTGKEWSSKIEHVSHLYDASAYRTKPRRLIIPWEVIKPEYKWAAMDSDGEVILHVEKPTQSNLVFISNCERVADIMKIDTTGIDWRESLVRRPDGV